MGLGLEKAFPAQSGDDAALESPGRASTAGPGSGEIPQEEAQLDRQGGNMIELRWVRRLKETLEPGSGTEAFLGFTIEPIREIA